jgi:predicted secreted protein
MPCPSLRGRLLSATAPLLAASLVAVAAGCRPDQTRSASGATPPPIGVLTQLRITERSAGEVLQVALGGTVTLELPLSSGTGYRWMLEAPPAPILEGDPEGRFVPRSEPRPGGPILQRWEFAAYAPGRVRLDLALRRPWEPEVEAAQRFSVQVAVVSPSNP